MAKSKRRRVGSKLQTFKNYRDDQYIPYIMASEIGILQAWTADPNLRDGDVRQTLRKLIKTLEKDKNLPNLLTDGEANENDSPPSILGFIGGLMLANLKGAFEKNGPLNVEDVIGILKVINNSVGTWNTGMNSTGYLTYIQGFLGQAGINIELIKDEEI